MENKNIISLLISFLPDTVQEILLFEIQFVVSTERVDILFGVVPEIQF